MPENPYGEALRELCRADEFTPRLERTAEKLAEQGVTWQRAEHKRKTREVKRKTKRQAQGGEWYTGDTDAVERR